jgi:hypothetical protein
MFLSFQLCPLSCSFDGCEGDPSIDVQIGLEVIASAAGDDQIGVCPCPSVALGDHMVDGCDMGDIPPSLLLLGSHRNAPIATTLHLRTAVSAVPALPVLGGECDEDEV